MDSDDAVPQSCSLSQEGERIIKCAKRHYFWLFSEFFSLHFQASKLKAVTYPLIGAVVGGICGGPVGLAVGLKAGAAIAVGGGILGFFGGKYFKKKQDEATEIQLDNLSSSKAMKKYH